jgi:hypothetical protein
VTERVQFLTAEDAEEYSVQHKSPCSDCPWARKALAGWTGALTTDEWLQAAHGEALIDCHTRKRSDGDHWQCAGAAIYRGNVCKTPRSSALLVLPADREKVFATPMEFRKHHD